MNAAPRPPPARPHVGIRSPSHFSSYSAADWGEDDAWDSASDSESPVATSATRPSSSAVSVPRRPTVDRSNSTLAFSYTHLNAPSPSSYPPRLEQVSPPPPQQSERKAGWTIVRTEQELRKSQEKAEEERAQADSEAKQKAEGGDIDVEGDMIVGDLEQDQAPSRPRRGKETIRPDVDEIVKGGWTIVQYVSQSFNLLYRPLVPPSEPFATKEGKVS
jgi:hypothetical protein